MRKSRLINISVKIERFQKITEMYIHNKVESAKERKNTMNALSIVNSGTIFKTLRLVDVEKVILPFLGKWKCRLPYVCASELTSILQKTEQLVQPLRGLQIEDLDAIGAIQAKEIANKPLCLIEEAFNNISKVKSGKRNPLVLLQPQKYCTWQFRLFL